LSVLILSACSKNQDSIPEPIYGQITGKIRQVNEYGLSAYAYKTDEASKIFLLNENRELLDSFEMEEHTVQNFNFDSIEIGIYFLEAVTPSFSTCQEFKIELSENTPEVDQVIELKQTIFQSPLDDFRIDSLIGNKLYHSFDITKTGGKTLEVRMYLSDKSDVSNENYKESIFNISAWAPERSGQYYTALEIESELYQTDSIYVAAYLVNQDKDECMGNNGLIFHYPFSEDFVRVAVEK